MKSKIVYFAKSRLACFLYGLFFLKIVSIPLSLVVGTSPKEAMPFNSYFEERRSECYLPADYSYELKSRVSDPELFEKFVDDIRMRKYKVGKFRYEYISENKQRGKVATFDGDMIIYSEYAH